MIEKVKKWYRDKFVYRARRSPHWPKVRAQHLANEGFCQWCGGIDKLEVHHIILFSEDPTKELLDSNLITLCEERHKECHLTKGHNGNWKTPNPTIREQCNKNRIVRTK